MPKQFHEAIVDDIIEGTKGRYPGVSSYDVQQVHMYASIIKRTIIPTNHDAIIKTFSDAANGVVPDDYIRQVIDHVEDERRRHAKASLHPYREGAMM